MTVQALLNMLEDGDATLQAFDLMVSQLVVTSLQLHDFLQRSWHASNS